MRIWQCPYCHFTPYNWISCLGPLTLLPLVSRQMVVLCFHPWSSRFHVHQTPLQVKSNCGLHSAARGIEKNALVMSNVAYHFAALDSRSCWSSSMSGTVAFSSGVTSFRPPYSAINLHSPLDFALAIWDYWSVSESCWLTFSSPVDESSDEWELRSPDQCDIATIALFVYS